MRYIKNTILVILLFFYGCTSFAGQDPITITTVESLPAISSASNEYPIEYRLTNTLPFPVTNLSITHTSTGTFVDGQATTTPCTTTLAGGQSCNWLGTFTPVKLGANSVTLTLHYMSSVIPLPQQTTTTENSLFMAFGYPLVETPVYSSQDNNEIPVYSSADGLNWQKINDFDDVVILSAVQHADQWVAVGLNQVSHALEIKTSGDSGANWTTASVSNLPEMGETAAPTVFYANNKYIAAVNPIDSVSSSIAPVLITSEDGKDWQAQSNLPVQAGDRLYTVSYANNHWVMLGINDGERRGPALVFTSTDGENWQKASITGDFYDVSDMGKLPLSYGQGKWITLGEDKTTSRRAIFSSTDNGDVWEESATDPFEEDDAIWGIQYHDGLWVAIGADQESATPIIYTSTNGEVWSKVPDILPDTLGLFNSIAYAHGKWIITGVAAAGTGFNGIIYSSTDGFVWTAATLTPTYDNYLNAIAHN
jgi:hypothetical protein